MSRTLRLTEEALAAYHTRRGVGNVELVTLERPAPAALLKPRESAIQAAVLELLRAHPAVAFCWRANTGAAQYTDESGGRRFVSYGFKGCPDILGMLRGGRLLAIECKRPGGKPTEEQAAFLEAVNGGGGLGAVVRGVDEAIEILKKIT